MSKRPKHQNKRQSARRHVALPPVLERPSANVERKSRVEYGKPIILLEDANKETFEFKGGQWSRHALNIAECRENCLVKELPQKVNGMSRYEIRFPVSTDT